MAGGGFCRAAARMHADDEVSPTISINIINRVIIILSEIGWHPTRAHLQKWASVKAASENVSARNLYLAVFIWRLAVQKL